MPIHGLLLCAAVASGGDDADLSRELEKERAARRALESRLDALERDAASRKDPLRAEVERYLEERPAPEPARHAPGFLEISAIVDVTAGGATAPLDGVHLGHHDPRVRGFNVRNEELLVSAHVDPYFHAQLDLVYTLDEEGESLLEVEEAFFETTSLPHGFQAKGGQFFTEFGRHNPLHPHAWEFLALPVIHGRVFGGDGWRGQGARVSWVAPFAPLMLLAGAQNARGETQSAFLGEEGEEVGAHEQQARAVRSLADLAWHVRVEASRDFGEGGGGLSALLGASFASGPNGTSGDARTLVWGADLFVKWRPATTDAGWPFLAWQTEFLLRRFEGAAQTRLVDDGMGGVVPLAVAAREYEDWGLYTQLVWGFRRPWTAGLRFDYADGDAFSGSHARVSVALTYHTSEFARIRLQLQYDDVEGLDEGVFGVWLNVNLSLGEHGTHEH